MLDLLNMLSVCAFANLLYWFGASIKYSVCTVCTSQD